MTATSHATCPGQDMMHLPEPAVMTYDERDQKRALVASQCREVIRTLTVTCECGKNVPVTWSFRCFYCGVWFCDPCARKHFGVPADYQRGE